MAAIDVLNPSTGLDPVLGYNSNWNYGSGRKANGNLQIQRLRSGPWNSRITANYGYTFPLTFVDRPIEQVRRLVHFYENFGLDGFTLVDFDNGGRHHVGCFTTPPQERHGANGKYTIDVTFEDLPGAAMLLYPSDFVATGHDLLVVDGKLNPRAAAMQGNWIAQLIPGFPAIANVTIAGTVYTQAAAAVPAFYEFYSEGAVAGDWVQTAYVGWGFQWSFRLAAGLGICDLYLDGALIVGALDLSTGIAAAQPGAVVSSNSVIALGGAGMTPQTAAIVTATSVPLDLHRLKLVFNAPNGNGGTQMIFPSMRYIY